MDDSSHTSHPTNGIGDRHWSHVGERLRQRAWIHPADFSDLAITGPQHAAEDFCLEDPYPELLRSVCIRDSVLADRVAESDLKSGLFHCLANRRMT